MSNLTTRELFEAVKEITPHIEALTEQHKRASADYLRARRDYDEAEADAFLAAKEKKVSDETAKRVALIKASDLKEKVDDLYAEKASAKVGSDAWQRVMEFYAALSHVLNREIKTFDLNNQVGSR